jgi:excisionase family DNA binding protein
MKSPSYGGAAPEAPRFYSVAQVAQMLGMSPMTVYRAISAGEFPAVRIRGRLIVPAKAVEAMADEAIADRTVVDASGFVPAGVALP